MKHYFEFAIDNIVKFGDTDIFPYPIENHIFYDKREDVLNLLLVIFDNYEEYITKYPPKNESMLVSSGYTGFRWATQIDPIWNAYFLGLVLSISNRIEEKRIHKDKNKVFSYRIKLDGDNKTIFDSEYGWYQFQKSSIEKAENYKYVLICDISHFYSNIYHHRLENSLSKLDISDKRIEKNIMSFLQKFSNIKSYGLPIGGQASRILAELLLNRTDHLLRTKSIEFCRFVDDYHIFANSEEELYESLLYLSKILIENEGLSLQKSKTRIISSEEFIQSTKLLFSDDQEELVSNKARQNLFSISLKYDPYSLTAEKDYENLKEQLSKVDIVGILSNELNKSRIHSAVTKKLLAAIKYLDIELINSTISSLLDNIEILLPVFPNVMILLNNVFEDLYEEMQNKVLYLLHHLINERSYIMQIDLNLAYALRVLANKYNDENEDLLAKLYETTESKLIKREIIIIMAKWGADFWISDLKNKYYSLDIWEKRSFILASFILGDEGRHWRKHMKKEFSPIDGVYRDWISEKVQQKGWVLPI